MYKLMYMQNYQKKNVSVQQIIKPTVPAVKMLFKKLLSHRRGRTESNLLMHKEVNLKENQYLGFTKDAIRQSLSK